MGRTDVPGWIGLYLDQVADWEEVARLLREGYALAAPKRLLAQLDHVSATKGSSR